MTALPESSGLLALPRLRIQNANAISSPLTHGFPSMTAFLGLMWALERRLAGRFPAGFDGVGVICHGFEEQATGSGYTRRFRLTRNPVDKDGSTAAIVEEGRIHLDITLVLGVSGGIVDQDEDTRTAFARSVADAIAQMRVAGGSVLPSQRWASPRLEVIPEDREEAARWFRRLRRRWLPGFALVCRDDLLAGRIEALRADDASASQLDAWLDLARFNWKPHRNERPDPATGAIRTEIEWRHDRSEGWIVPIPVGHAALSDLHPPGTVANARDASTQFRFVESVYSIGAWIGPHRLTSWRELLWYGDADLDSGLYRVRNDYAAVLSSSSQN